MLLERYFAWSGVLIEGDPRPLKKLTDRNRAAFIAKCCLSTTIRPKVVHDLKVKYNKTVPLSLTSDSPSQMTFLRHQTGEGLTFIRGKRHFIGGEDKYQPFESQCFPIYAILSALNLTTVDYFSLDIEGAELDVLKTIPWNKVLIKVKFKNIY